MVSFFKSFYSAEAQKKAILLSAVSFLIAVGLIIGIVAYILRGSISIEERIEVVSVYSVTEVVAVQTLKDIGLKVEIRRATNIEIPKGLVYEQSPLPGEKVNRGELATLYISEGGARRPVPHVVGFEVIDAERILTSSEYGYVIEKKSEISLETIGVVVRQDPQRGELLAPGEVVRIFVSAGTERVPDLRSEPVDSALAQLTELGFVGVVQNQPHDEIAEGLVINTRPGPNLPVDESREVVLLVSSGPPS